MALGRYARAAVRAHKNRRFLGSLAFRIIAFEMTQMSVHSPISSTDSSSGTRAICSASSNEPNTG